MDDKRRSKRSKVVDEGYWDCSVCTYQNSPEAFKCDMCDVRKGTSTRKPRLNAQLVAQQVAQQFAPPPPAKKERPLPLQRRDKNNASTSDSPMTHGSKKRTSRLKNIDRSSGISMEVTVGNVTVVITDYKPKTDHDRSCDNASPDANLEILCDSLNNESSEEKADNKNVDSDVNGDMDTVNGNS